MQVYMGGIAPTYLASLKKNTCLTIYLAGCDFKCPYCEFSEYLDFKQEYLIDIIEAKKQINSVINNYDTILFSGGEPTLQRQALINLARHCKSLGLKVGISTNGSRPATIAMILREDILDFIEIDLKSPLESEKFEKITCSKNFFNPTENIMNEYKETLNLLKKNENKVKIFFKTTIIPELLDEKDLLEMAKLIENIKSIWIIQSVNTDKNLDKHFPKNTITNERLNILKKSIEKEFKTMNIGINEITI